jgi:anti-sigma-K factor RskA
MIMENNVKELETVQAEEPKLVVELALKEWEAVLAVIENSTSPHIQVKSVSAELVKQLQPQVKTTEE